MTFDAIKQAIKGHCNLNSPEADTRVGESINRHYKRVTSLLGMDATRFVTRSMSTTIGVQTVTFSEIEKIDRVLDTTDSTNVRLLPEVSFHMQRVTQPGAAEPCTWAPQSMTASTVTIRLDTVPQAAYSLQADGWASLADLTGNDEPAFPASFHDVLTWHVLSEELIRKEKLPLAQTYERKAGELLAALQFHFADSPTRDVRQGSLGAGLAIGSGTGAGGGTLGATAYTQTANINFDLGAGIAPFTVAQSDAAKVANLDADELDGEDGAFYLDRANHTGSLNLTVADLPDHASEHANGGGDELNVTGLSGLLADKQTPVPAGTNTQVQFNDSGTQAGDAGLTYNKTTDALTVAGALSAASVAATSISATTVSAATVTASTSLALTGGQAVFPATQVPSSNANTLDDYEEGTWTPADGSAAVTITNVEGHYVKIGQLVVATCSFVYPANASGANTLITGLPFTILDTTNDIYMAQVFGSAVANHCAVGLNNTTTLTFLTSQGLSQRVNSDFSNTVVRFTLIYRATA